MAPEESVTCMDAALRGSLTRTRAGWRPPAGPTLPPDPDGGPRLTDLTQVTAAPLSRPSSALTPPRP